MAEASRVPRLSLCVITKNEERNLPRCLRSVAHLVDEIIITDTGSTDGTVKIARAAGATVLPFEWCDDFAAAYNHGLEHATGDWILILDADEELAPESESHLTPLLERDDAFAYSLLRQDYFGDEIRDNARTEMLQTRLLRRRDAVRFVGRIHQQLEPTLTRAAHAEGRRVLASELRIRHYGYMGTQPAQKLARSIRLLELELRDRPDQFYYLVELGRSKLANADPTGIEPLTRAAAQLNDGTVSASHNRMALLLIEQLLAIDELPGGFPFTHDQLESMGTTHYPTSIPLTLQYARRRFQNQQFDRAAEHIEHARNLATSGHHDRSCSFNPEILAESTLNLGVCYAHLGRIEEAINCFDALADHPTHGPAALQNATALRRLVE